MNVHTTDSGSARRLFKQSSYTGGVYTNDAGAQDYINNMMQVGIASEDMIQSVVNVNQYVAEEREQMIDLWASGQQIATLAVNPIHAINSHETVINATPVMMDYLFSEPKIYHRFYGDGTREWDDYTPAPNTTMWETVNTGSTTMSGKDITITEFINSAPKLTVTERICILDAQKYLLDEYDEDPWSSEIIYY